MEYCEPQAVAQYEDQNYSVIFHVFILLKATLSFYPEEHGLDLRGVINDEMREKNLLCDARRILVLFLDMTDDLGMPVAESVNNANMNIQTPLTERIQRLGTKIDSLFSWNISYSSVLQSYPIQSLQPEQQTIAPALS